MTTDSPLDSTHLFVDHASELLMSPEAGSPRLAWTIGVDEDGGLVTDDIGGGEPHLFITGTGRSGKTELLDSMIYQLAHNSSAADLELWLLSGGGLETWAGLPHTKRFVDLTDASQVEEQTRALMGAARQEMERRFQVLAAHPSRPMGITQARAIARREGSPTGERHPLDFPYIVVVIEDASRALQPANAFRSDDPFARLAKATVDDAEALARMARAAGIVLVVASRHALPSAFGGVTIIKQQCRRIGLAAYTAIDSVAAIDQQGLETLSLPGSGMAAVGTDYRPFRSFHLRWPSEERPQDPDDRADLLARLVA